ncbi:MAG: hypothetical protein ABJ239_06880 [Erythrobacter sp.]
MQIDTAPQADEGGAEAGGQASNAWAEMRAESDIQFTPVDVPPRNTEPPEWLRQLSEWLGEVFDPVARALANSWPVLKWVLLALAIAALLYIIYRIVEPLLSLRPSEEEEEYIWQIDQAEALALLEDADKLAANGKYDAATHLLLQRSIAQIAQAKPDLVEPSSTARELAALPALPDNARTAFGTIAERVERSLFALRALNQTDWEEARAAYADFALERIDGRILDRTASNAANRPAQLSGTAS